MARCLLRRRKDELTLIRKPLPFFLRLQGCHDELKVVDGLPRWNCSTEPIISRDYNHDASSGPLTTTEPARTRARGWPPFPSRHAPRDGHPRWPPAFTACHAPHVPTMRLGDLWGLRDRRRSRTPLRGGPAKILHACRSYTVCLNRSRCCCWSRSGAAELRALLPPTVGSCESCLRSCFRNAAMASTHLDHTSPALVKRGDPVPSHRVHTESDIDTRQSINQYPDQNPVHID